MLLYPFQQYFRHKRTMIKKENATKNIYTVGSDSESFAVGLEAWTLCSHIGATSYIPKQALLTWAKLSVYDGDKYFHCLHVG